MAEDPKPQPVSAAADLAIVTAGKLDMTDDKLAWTYEPKSGVGLEPAKYDALLTALKEVLKGALAKYPVEGINAIALTEGLTITPSARPQAATQDHPTRT